MSDDLVRRLRDNSVGPDRRDELMLECGKLAGAGCPRHLVDGIIKWNDLMHEAADALERQRESDELLRECIQFVSGGAMKLQCNSDESDRQCLNRTKEELLKRIDAHLPPPPAKRD